MKRILIPTLLLLGLMTWACKEASTTQAETENPEGVWGTGVANTSSARPFAEIAGLLEAADTVKTVLRAKVDEVCQAKGCWMNIVDPSGETAEAIFVQFKDYGFFVPKDLAGKEVYIEGVAYKEQTSVEDLKHYAEDAGKSAEEIAAITEPVTEKKFMATGVEIVK